MARSKFSIQYSSVEKAENAIEKILMSNNFMETNYYGEPVWKRYNESYGITALQYLQIEYDNQFVHISAWVGSEGSHSEMDLNGFAGMIPKRKLQKIIEELEAAIQEG